MRDPQNQQICSVSFNCKLYLSPTIGEKAWILPNKFVDYHELLMRVKCLLNFYLEIYRIVSQKQLRDPSEEEATIRPNNVETINVKPTVNSESVRKQCCNS